MARKPAVQAASPKSSTPTPKQSTPTPAVKAEPSSISSPAPVPKPASSLTPRSSPQEIALHVWDRYLNDTPSRTLLLDVFMAFLVVVGALQFLYCLLAGNYPFNAFLSGFSAAVGQFVLTASLRMQTSERPISSSAASKRGANKTVDGATGELIEEGHVGGVSSERAFADFVFGSLILHGFCVNFIN